MPVKCTRALDIGSGLGVFTRLLARSGIRVTGVDISPKMVEKAREMSANSPGVEYVCDDIMAMDFPDESFDFIVSIATFHHLPLEKALPKIGRWLRPGGVLAVVDLYQPSSLPDLLLSAFSVLAGLFYSLQYNGQVSPDSASKRAWEQHLPHDRYSTVLGIRHRASVLPGARVRRLLFWRYSLVWTRPGTPAV
jgi:SAM-dependent methyltransferase